MSHQVDEQLAALGFAQVMAILKTPPKAPSPAGAVSLAAAAAPPAMASLERHFISPAESADSQMLRSIARRTVRTTRLKADLSVASVASLASSIAEVAPPPRMRVYSNLGIVLGNVDRQGLAALEREPSVSEVVGSPALRLIRPVGAVRTRLATGVTWGLARLGIPALWSDGLTGKGVLIGHLDTGVDAGHPALKGAIAHFAEFDFLGAQVPGAVAHDSDEHGTHTAGTIAGRKVGKTAFGVAPAAQLASALVIEGGNVVARILAGMNWVVGLRVRALSMSLGLPGYREDFRALTQRLRQLNVLPIFAVGNEGPGTSRYPGNYPETLSVGASADDDTVADFSSSQRFNRPDDPWVPDLVGPGVDVLSCVPGNKYATMSGSSMATPHIAGLAALLFEARPSASCDQVEKAIFDSCTRPATMAQERANRGVPDGPTAAGIIGKAKKLAASRPAKKKRAAKKPIKKSTRKTAKKKGRPRAARK